MPDLTIIPNTITASVMDVTPDLAAQWLGSNHSNRNLRGPLVRAYARDMTDGKWQMTGEAIKFDSMGVLRDGQHRLAAVVKSGATVQMLVIRGIATEAQAVMDSGAKRQASDMLAMSGIQQASTVAAVARLAIIIERGSGEKTPVTHSEIAAWVAANGDVIAAVELARKVYRRVDLSPAIIGYTAMTLGRIDLPGAWAFWTDAADKIGLDAGDPVIAMTNLTAELRRQGRQLPTDGILSVIYRAWNARRSGKPLSVLKVNSPKGGLVAAPTPR